MQNQHTQKGASSSFIISEKAINFRANEGSGKRTEQMRNKYIFEYKGVITLTEELLRV